MDIFNTLKSDKSVYFHCHIGADRTGYMAMLIEGLLGVSEKDCSIDYELTSFSDAAGSRYRNGEPVWYTFRDGIKYLRDLPGTTFQNKIENYLVNTVGIKQEDIDDFKSINDTYGHSEGDHALQSATNILKHARQDDEWVFRYAGDEFVVLKRANDPYGLDAFLHRVHEGLDEFNTSDHPYRLSLSYGVSVLDGQSVDAFMGDMDRKMYEMKAEHHKTL